MMSSYQENLNILTSRCMIKLFNHHGFGDSLLKAESFKLFQVLNCGWLFPRPYQRKVPRSWMCPFWWKYFKIYCLLDWNMRKKFHQNPFVIKATLKSTNKTNIIFCNLDKIGLSDNEAGRALNQFTKKWLPFWLITQLLSNLLINIVDCVGDDSVVFLSVQPIIRS